MKKNINKTICLILPNLDAGGAERVMIIFARILKANGFAIQFINLGNPSGEMLPWIVPEFQLFSFGCKRTILSIFRLRCFIRQHKDYFFFSSREHTNIATIIASLYMDNRVIVRLPNMPYNKLYGNNQTYKQHLILLMNRFLLKRASLIIAQNSQMKDQILRIYGIKDSLVVVINNPVDKDNIINSLDRSKKVFNTPGPNLLSVGNISYAKGFDVLIDAFNIVRTKKEGVSLYIIGRYNSEYAKELYSKNKDMPDIHFLGFQDNPYNYMDQCDLFILPSRMEGFPNVVLEALSLNKKIVATDCVDIISQLIEPPKNGFICPVENAKKMAEMILKAIDLQYEQVNYSLFDEKRFISLFN